MVLNVDAVCRKLALPGETRAPFLKRTELGFIDTYAYKFEEYYWTKHLWGKYWFSRRSFIGLKGLEKWKFKNEICRFTLKGHLVSIYIFFFFWMWNILDLLLIFSFSLRKMVFMKNGSSERTSSKPFLALSVWKLWLCENYSGTLINPTSVTKIFSYQCESGVE